jgi:5-methylthioadenosine/S-adenosylhomocysteine deaminase
MYQEMKALADEKDTWIYSHVAEVFDEVKLVKELVGKRPVEYLDDLGVLDDNCLLAHVIWVTDGEIDRIARSGANVTHQPICNQYLASGVAPVPKMLEKGVDIGMGIDDGGHTNQDYCSLMKHGSLLHKVDQYDATAISAEKILEMATIGGAKAIGKADTIGSLEPGKQANIILFDQNKLNLTPRLRPVTNLVYGATAKDVETTIINGDVVMQDREFPDLNEEAIRETAEEEAWDLVERVGIEELVTRSTEDWDRPDYGALCR